MPSVTIEDFPDDLYETLRMRAEASGQSIEQEAILCLRNGIHRRRIDPEGFLAGAQALRQRFSLPPLTDEILREAKDEGRR